MSAILTDSGLVLAERNAVGARSSAKVLAASSLGSCLVFLGSAVAAVACVLATLMVFIIREDWMI